MTFDAYHYERELRIANTILQHADSPEVRKSAQEAIDFWEERLAKFYETSEGTNPNQSGDDIELI